MNNPSFLFSALRQRTRLIGLVLLALALQPLAWAQQAAVEVVTLPYCATAPNAASAQSQTADGNQPANPAPAHPSYVLLLQTATVCSHDQAQTWMPPHHAAPFSAPPSLHYGFVSIRAWAQASAGRHLRPLSRAPPQHA